MNITFEVGCFRTASRMRCSVSVGSAVAPPGDSKNAVSVATSIRFKYVTLIGSAAFDDQHREVFADRNAALPLAMRD